MNESDQNHDPVNIADLHDRLMDRALAETIGRETPPDLSTRILAGEPKCAPVVGRRRPRAWRAALLAVAATLLVAIPIYLTQQGSLHKDEFRSAIASAKLDRLSSKLKTGNNAIGRQGQVNDTSGPPQAGKIRDRGKAVLSPAPAGAEGRLTLEETDAHYVPLASTRVPISETAPVAQPSPSFQAPEPGPDGLQFGVAVAPDEKPPGKDADLDSLVDVLQSTVHSGERVESVAGKKPFPTNLSLSTSQTQAVLEEPPLEGDRFASLGESFHSLPELESIEIDGRRKKYSRDDLGTGAGSPGDQYTRIYENPFIKAVGGDAVSTFSIDVDTASYANVRQFLMDMRQLPPPDAVRIEELVNYFPYDYAAPTPSALGSAGGNPDAAPFAAHVEVAGCPWSPEHRLVRIGIKGREIKSDKRPPSNLVFLVDVSGSMDEPNKLPLVVDGLRQLTRELGENDRVAIVVYASSEGLALESTRGDKQAQILAALDKLKAGGSTAGGAGIQLAYKIAEDHFIPGGANRVILCTDGDFNVGVTSTAELERLVAQKAKETRVFLSVLGFGRGNLNDAMMQTIADRGNGNHHYVDNLREARKVLVEEMTGTLITIAKDVKLQVEFNPAQVAAYRLLGYENRMLRTEDFNDDKKDAGEIGAGHTVTALYEVVPADKADESTNMPAVDDLKYQQSPAAPAESAVEVAGQASGELLTLKMRYKEPEGDVSRKLEWPVSDAGTAFQDATDDYQFAAAVASFGLLLRGSEYKGEASYGATAEIAQNGLGRDEHGYRAEFVDLVRRAKELQASR